MQTAVDLIHSTVVRDGASLEVTEPGLWFVALLRSVGLAGDSTVQFACSPYYVRWASGLFQQPPPQMIVVLFVAAHTEVVVDDSEQLVLPEYLMTGGTRSLRVIPTASAAMRRVTAQLMAIPSALRAS